MSDPHLWQAALAMARTAGEGNLELRTRAILPLVSVAVEAWRASAEPELLADRDAAVRILQVTRAKMRDLRREIRDLTPTGE